MPVGVGLGMSPQLQRKKSLSIGERAMALLSSTKLYGIAVYNGMVGVGKRIIGFVNNFKI